MDVLLHIKRIVLQGRVRFTRKAQEEMEDDGLSETDVLESVINAHRISKVIASRTSSKALRREKLYVIKSFNFSGTLIYSKGKIVRQDDEETFYIFVSSKVSTGN